MQQDAYDALADRVEAMVHHQSPPWRLHILRYEQLPSDLKTHGTPPWVRFTASLGDPTHSTVLGPFAVHLERQSAEELVREIKALLDHVWQLQRTEWRKTGQHAQPDEAG